MKLFKHQQDLIDINPKKWLIAHSVGTGKTLTALTLVKNNNCKSVLVICPKSLVQQWEEQVSHSTKVLSKEQFKKYAKELPYYEALIIDEAHFFSNYKSQLTKALLYYIKAHNPPYIYLLTGTPYLSSIWNIYTYGLILGREWKWIDWNRKFFTKIRMGNMSIPVQKKVVDGKPIKEVVSLLVSRLGNAIHMNDCFDVPEQVFIKETFEFTREQKKAIEELTDLLPIVRFTKIHQICGGTLKSDGYCEDAYFKSDKLDRVLELINENKKLVVICRYNNEIAYIKSKLLSSKKCFVINGHVKNRHEVVNEAEASDNCVVLIQAACSEGYGLPSFPVMVFYSYDFSLKNYVQILGRIQRAGHLKKNVYISLITNKSIDYDIYDSVVNKKMDFMVELYIS